MEVLGCSASTSGLAQAPDRVPPAKHRQNLHPLSPPPPGNRGMNGAAEPHFVTNVPSVIVRFPFGLIASTSTLYSVPALRNVGGTSMLVAGGLMSAGSEAP